MEEWSKQNNVFLDFINPGKPMENAICESFNGRFRDECLNENWFQDPDHARNTIEEWRDDYNRVRPHGSLGNLTPKVRYAPKEFARFFNKIEVSA